MNFYMEGIVWYLFLFDAIIYNCLCWSKGKLHQQDTHWISNHFPLHRFWGFYYLIFVLWTGYTLYRMQIIKFY